MKSNAEIARDIVARCLTLSDIESMGAQSLGSLTEGVESALTRAQSQLAKEVLAAIRGVEAEYHAEKRLRDLFKRLNVSVDEPEKSHE